MKRENNLSIFIKSLRKSLLAPSTCSKITVLSFFHRSFEKRFIIVNDLDLRQKFIQPILHTIRSYTECSRRFCLVLNGYLYPSYFEEKIARSLFRDLPVQIFAYTLFNLEKFIHINTFIRREEVYEKDLQKTQKTIFYHYENRYSITEKTLLYSYSAYQTFCESHQSFSMLDETQLESTLMFENQYTEC